MSAHPSRLAYIAHIDGLRALAVLAVVFYHLDPVCLPGGFTGVDIFFVISGFIVSAASTTLDASHIGRFLAAFYARRFIRILPALLVCLLVTSFLTALFIPSAWLSSGHQKAGLFAFFGLSNFILAQTQNDYFSTAAELNPYTHTWSLGVEEQFYLIFPLLFFGGLQAGRRRWLARCLFGAGFVASLAYALLVPERVMAFYMIASRFWQLAAGNLLYQAMCASGCRFDQAEVPAAAPRGHGLAAGVALLVVLWGLLHASPATFPFPSAFFPVIGSLGLIYFLHGLKPEHPLRRLFTCAPVRFIGRISYSLYLWHWPVFVLCRWTIGLGDLPTQTAAVLLALLLAILSYRYIETPCRRSLFFRRLARPAIIGLGLLALAGGAWLANRITEAQPRLARNTVTRHAADWYPDRIVATSSHPGCHFRIDSAALGSGVVLEFMPQDCPVAKPAPHLFATGDSHALSYTGVYALYALEVGAPVTLYNNGGCPFLSLQPDREASAHCRDNARRVLADILERVKPGDIVFFPSLRLPRYADQGATYTDSEVHDAVFSATAEEKRRSAVAAGKVILQQLQARGAKIILEAPKPIFRVPVFRCADAYTRGNPVCAPGLEMPREELEALRQPVLAALQELADAVPGAMLWDPFPVLCPPGRICPAFVAGNPLFFDGDHLSAYANRLLFPDFLTHVRRLAARDSGKVPADAAQK
jgi:peptidoglycan/LPS O-acetylase OafA/YrhL